MLRIVWHQSSIHTWKNSTTNFTLFVYFMITSWLHHDCIEDHRRISLFFNKFRAHSLGPCDLCRLCPPRDSESKHQKVSPQNDDPKWFAFKACCSNHLQNTGVPHFWSHPVPGKRMQVLVASTLICVFNRKLRFRPKVSHGKICLLNVTIACLSKCVCNQMFRHPTMDIKENMGSIVLKFVFD